MPEKAALFNLLASGSDKDDQGDSSIKRALKVIREHLGMDVAYVSEFVGDNLVFREVDAPGLEAIIKPGDSRSLDDAYCRHILEGRLPELMPDTSVEPLAMSMPVTHAVPVGRHMSVPIRLADGSPYGMFCCLGATANPSLNERDLNMMRAFAELASFDIIRELDAKREKDEKLSRIKSALDEKNISIAYQPIWHIEEDRPIGLECLARFNTEPRRTPDLWFNEATEVGFGVELELAAIELALCALSETLPDDLYLAVNASPATVVSPGFAELLASYPGERIVLEITEHAHVPDYDELLDALKGPRARGVRLAVDDAGAGYSGLQHILQLQPDIIKLDMSLTRNIDLDPARRALASALIQFARDTGCRIIAEGVETASELKALKALGVEKAQGYYLARPMPLEGAMRLLADMSGKKTRVA